MKKPDKPRKYQIIWDKIKVNGRCTIEVVPALQARVKKAVIKEKNKDMAFKLVNDHDYFFLEVTEIVKDKKHYMTFILKQRWGLEGVKDEREFGKEVSPNTHPTK